MEKIFIPEKKAYKANLHSHSTDSDGKLSPEELKKLYKDNGYSVLAYTDHMYMRDRTSLCDDEFVAISGYENSILDWKCQNGLNSKCYHINFYSPKPDKVGMVGVTEYFFNYFTDLVLTGNVKYEAANRQKCSEKHPFWAIFILMITQKNLRKKR